MLTYTEAERFYDSFGKKQDKQFYEEAAINELIAHSDLTAAHNVVEFGCGTGKLASKLLNSVFSDDCNIVCIDISATMIALCKRNTRRFSNRVSCMKIDGSPTISMASQSADRFIATYVIDLLSKKDGEALIIEAARILKPDGILCLAGLTHGTTPGSRFVEFIWNNLYRVNPKIVGGCRPIDLKSYVQGADWQISHDATVVSFGVPSEILIARRL